VVTTAKHNGVTLYLPDGSTYKPSRAGRDQLSAMPQRREGVRGSYDAAGSQSQWAKHWANADALSPRAANSPGIRRLLRMRARYEVSNNSYAKGMLRTLANYVVGSGPRLQVLTEDEQYNEQVETLFQDWAKKVRLARKLWTMRFAWCQDGEAFGLWVTNLTQDHPVKLNLKLIETDQVTDYVNEFPLQVNRSDGIILNDDGNVAAYRILPQHPGDDYLIDTQPETVSAGDVSHLFTDERPGQLRGVPQITPALMLYPIMRRYTLASLLAAESAAKIAGVIQSQATPEDPDDLEPLDALTLDLNEFWTMPAGWQMNQLKAEHPSTQYADFKREVIAEGARCIDMPVGIALADSSKHNFASGKLDHLGFFKAIGIDQDIMTDEVIDPAFEKWFAEASRIDGYLPAGPNTAPAHTWFWEGQELLDPREATAKATGLAHGFDTLGRIYARRGLDARREMTANAKLLGMTYDEYAEALRNKLFDTQTTGGAGRNNQDDEESDDE